MKSNELFSDVLKTVTKYFKWLVLVIVVLICVSGIKSIKSGEVAIILRFGKVVGDTPEEQIHEPGLLFAFPYIIDEVITVPTGTVNELTVTTQFTDGQMTTMRRNGYVITGDSSIVLVQASVKYSISDPVAYALNVSDASGVINAVISNALVVEAASRSGDSLLTSGKDAYGRAVIQNAQSQLTALDVGILLNTIELTNVSMPNEVKSDYDAVNAAKAQAGTINQMALEQAAATLLSAQTRAAALINEAEGDYSLRIAAANTDLSEFNGLLSEYRLNPEVVRTRVYSAKVSEAVAKIGTVRLVQDGETKIFIN